MNTFQIVADESADYTIVTELRNAGYSVYAISEQLPSLSDKEVLETMRYLLQKIKILESLYIDFNFLTGEYYL